MEGAGWCPGQDVAPHIVEITENVVLGEENIIDYDACRVSGGGLCNTSCMSRKWVLLCRNSHGFILLFY